jgi:hypothetical protein
VKAERCRTVRYSDRNWGRSMSNFLFRVYLGTGGRLQRALQACSWLFIGS